MIAKTEAEARRQVAVLERRRVFLERWSQPRVKRAYLAMGDVAAQQYVDGGIERIENNIDQLAGEMVPALESIYKKANDTLLALAKMSAKSFGGKVEKKAEEDELGEVYEEVQWSFSQEAFEKSKYIAETFAKDIVKEIRLAIAEDLELFNQGPDAISKFIRSHTGIMAPWKADMIARTEAGMSMNEAQAKYTESLWDEVEDGPLYKKWHSAGGSRTRRDHKDMNGKIVPKDSSFVVGSGKNRTEMRFPMDRKGKPKVLAQLVNCRCGYSVIPEELVPPSQRNSDQ